MLTPKRHLKSTFTIKKDLWWDILSRLIQILKINLFLVDTNGSLILPPDDRRYGGSLYLDSTYLFSHYPNDHHFLKKFTSHGKTSMKAEQRFGLTSYAIAIQPKVNLTIGYLILGPVIMGKRKEASEIQQLCREYQYEDFDRLYQLYSGIKIFEDGLMHSTIELLAEMIKESLLIPEEESQITHFLDQSHLGLASENEDLKQEALNIVHQIHYDEILTALLDLAIKLARAESGSIMIYNKIKQHFRIRVSRAVSADFINHKIPFDQTIAAEVVKHKKTIFLKNHRSQYQHFLKRPEIKVSIILPLLRHEDVFGVLNLCSSREDNLIARNRQNLEYLTHFFSKSLTMNELF